MRQDNNARNNEILTRAEQILVAVRHYGDARAAGKSGRAELAVVKRLLLPLRGRPKGTGKVDLARAQMLRREGWTLAAIAKQLGVSHQAISAALRSAAG